MDERILTASQFEDLLEEAANRGYRKAMEMNRRGRMPYSGAPGSTFVSPDPPAQQSNVSQTQEVLDEFRPSSWMGVPVWTVSFLISCSFIWGAINLEMFFLIGFLIIPIIWSLIPLFRIYTQRLIVYKDGRCVFERKFISRKATEVNSTTSSDENQGLMGRIFDYGTIEVIARGDRSEFTLINYERFSELTRYL